MSAWKWWGSQRLRYNIVLASAGFVAFLLYVTLVWTFQEELPEAEVTAFIIAFQALGFFALMLVANVCFFLGPISERLLRPNDVLKYRHNTFALGVWFSVALPFLLPATVVLTVVGRA
jgi:hypothetical protein